MARVLVALVLVVWVYLWAAIAEAEYVRYKDPKQPVAVRVRDLLRRMTLEEKIGQMVQIDRSVANVETLSAYSIGNVYTSMSVSVLVCEDLHICSYVCVCNEWGAIKKDLLCITLHNLECYYFWYAGQMIQAKVLRFMEIQNNI